MVKKVTAKELVYLKKDIVHKYDHILPVKLVPTEAGLIEFSQTLDRYYMQALEECYEVREEAYNSLDRLEELGDVINYMASITYVMLENYTDDINNLAWDTDLTIDELSDDIFINLVFDTIFTIRRKFPERKWHKPTTRTYQNLDVNSDILYDPINMMIKVINYGINLLYSKTKEIDIDIPKLLIGKHKYIEKISIIK